MAEAAVQHVQPMPKNPILVIRDRFDARLNELRTALPPHIKPDHFVRAIMTAIQINPDLAACEWSSLWNATMRCAADGLVPDGKEAAFVPYKGKVQYQPMYQGYLKQFRNSGQFKEINVGVVREGDAYRYYVDENGQHFYHEPGDDTDENPIRRVYANAITKDGGKFVAPLSMAQINKRRAMSRATRDDSPWKMWPEEMMLKTAIKALAKFLPKSSDIEALIERDDEQSFLATEPLGVLTPPTERLSTRAALDHFGSAAEQEPATVQSETPDATDVAADSLPRAESAASSDDEQTRKVRIAFLLGQEAKKKGMSAKAMAPEYRERGREAEADAWRDGHASVG
jgi:recombination protein RecT